MALEASFSRARDHPRWRTLVDLPNSASQPQSPRLHRNLRRQQLRRRFGLYALAADDPRTKQSTAATSAREDTRDKSKPASTNPVLGPNYSPEEQTLRNDYSQRFVDTGAGHLPGNAVRNPSSSSRFDEYPKLKRLVQLKDSLVTRIAHPPTYLQTDLRPSLEPFRNPLRSSDQFHLGSLIPVKYDVVLIDPPLEAYEWEASPAASTSPISNSPVTTWSWEEIAALPVPQLAAKESFVFLWVGSGAGDGLDRGREVLAKWGYRRCEDIVFVRTNPQSEHGDAQHLQPSTSSAFTRCSQHCLMGIRGTVRRSTDSRFVHCNIDTDVILWSGQDEQQTSAHKLPDMISKPPELYQLIENFCLGTRRLELFGRNRNLRRGWLTIGLELGPDAPGWPQDGKLAVPSAGLTLLQEDGDSGQFQARLESLQIPRPYDKAEYDSNFGVDRPGCDLKDRSNLLPFVEEVDQLRPKSPPPRGGKASYPRNGIARNTPESQVGPTSDQYHLGLAGTTMPSGLSNNPALRSLQQSAQPDHPFATAGALVPPGYPIGLDYSAAGATAARSNPGGAGLSGLGAGGARTVSVPSGSDTLSGPQASVLKAKAMAEAAATASINTGPSTPDLAPAK